ncbi:MAG: hypothetical protein PHR32_07750 [Candidatus Cloacimonetes bacterium]|jgi:hypothetical protein|nr:hypothetical protein [Candidatus Cloacimonadota bacterium]
MNKQNEHGNDRAQVLKVRIKHKADDAWECEVHKEMINLNAELICRFEKEEASALLRRYPGLSGIS